MLATIDNGGVYHSAHIIALDRPAQLPRIPFKVISYPVFSSDPTINSNEASQVQYAMSKDDAPYGTAPAPHEQRPGDHRQDRHHEQRPVGVLHRRHPEPGPGRRAVHQRAGRGQADPGPARRPLPGRHGRHLAGVDLAHLRRGSVPPARDRAVPHPVFTGATWNQVPPNLRNVGRSRRGTTTARRHGNGNGNGTQPRPDLRRQPERRRQRDRRRRPAAWAAAAVAGPALAARPGGRPCGHSSACPCWRVAAGESAGAKAARRRADRENRGQIWGWTSRSRRIRDSAAGPSAPARPGLRAWPPPSAAPACWWSRPCSAWCSRSPRSPRAAPAPGIPTPASSSAPATPTSTRCTTARGFPRERCPTPATRSSTRC